MKYRITENERLILNEVAGCGGQAYLGLIRDSLQKQLSSGSIHNVLSRLERAGCIKSELKKLDGKGPGRRTVRMYEIMPNGEAVL